MSHIATTSDVPAGNADVWKHWLRTSSITLAGWIICETVGGLLFLAAGVRLWTYHITPVFWSITSLVGWAFVWLVAGNLCFAYLMWESRAGVADGKRWLYRSLFLMIAGPINEVLWNTLIWGVAGRPLYLYTVWPTFSGSGSFLSPFYYLTLLLGFWLEEQLPASLAARASELRGARAARTRRTSDKSAWLSSRPRAPR